MKGKRSWTKIDDHGAGAGASCVRNEPAPPPAFVLRLPLAARLGPDIKSSQTVFEKTVNSQRIHVVQTVVANGHAKRQGATRAAIPWLADWPSIPAPPSWKHWVH